MATLTLRILSNAGDITKGSTLTSSELDQNLISLNNELATKFTKTGDTITGNVNFSGAGLRITGDFSNGTASDRVLFQTTTSGSVTAIEAIPLGTITAGSNSSTINLNENEDATNGAISQITMVKGTDMRIAINKRGTGSYLPMTFYTGGSERGRIDINGAFGIGITPETSWSTGKKVLRIGAGGFIYGDSSTTDQIAVGSNSYFDGTNVRYISTSTSCRYFMGSGAHTFNVAASGTAGDIVSYSTPLSVGITNSTFASHAIPAATNTYDLGTTALRWRNIYTQDLHLSNGIGDYTVVEGVENLYLVNNKTNKSFKFALIEVDPAEVPAKSQVA